ncbi:HEAT repeat domain-containing protein [Litchfieldella xinjiangensis]|uniref:HEAT repeat domain-containing protein n=1 Tax=Litchfieldella xinjiangensis TaxID=1166948 RepID=UPI000ACBA49B|nr:HEAT repeat domain-containing protein [Halomonas xinjiangensis]
MPSEGTPFSLLASLPEDAILRAALYSAIGLVILTLAIMGQILILSELAARRERRRRAFQAFWRPRLAMASLGEGEPDAASHATLGSRQARLWFLLLWLKTQRQLKGSARERLNVLLGDLGLVDSLLRLLEGAAVHHTLVALSCLRYLADPGHWAAVVPLLASRNTVVSMAAVQTLVSLDASRAMWLIMPQVAQRTDWALPRLVAVCRQAGREVVTGPLLESLEAGDDQERRRLVELLAWAEPSKAAPWARRILDVDGEEVMEPGRQEAALRCLGELGDPRDRPRLCEALAHALPQVRHAAVLAFGKQSLAEDDEILAPLLADQSWWVRQAAADTLVALPGMSSDRLDTLLDSIEDRYGQDALRRARIEGGQ